MVKESPTTKISFDLFLQKKPLRKIDPIIKISDYHRLDEKNKFTYKIFTEMCLISDQLVAKGIKPMILGGFACALVTDNFYREHDDIDFGIVYDSKIPLHIFYQSLIDLFKSFGYGIDDRKTFENFFQFLLTNKEGFRFELDIFALRENRSKYFFEPTPTSPFKRFDIEKNTLPHVIVKDKYELFVPKVIEVKKIKQSDDRLKGKLDIELLEKKRVQNLKEIMQNRHN